VDSRAILGVYDGLILLEKASVIMAINIKVARTYIMVPSRIVCISKL
jgi:hypothetical protein